ncbi:MOSC domain-containing protein [Clostridium magnum]|uniref:MOSC domain protein n=1 Tax=Clostridium magnum DSM 2767 TaxID=1121326 RepID=A0A161WR60_9CLOT|nr:MOSC domain-containing protein [Clostridium magnum]KZL89188.1 MOSC domain protein [Clostridium magnum DSM 2767]SHJ24165.1 MOSC domain-containing protein YiiM [Clostridium magnum DSM 2767]
MAKITAVNISTVRGIIKTPIDEGKLVVNFGIEGDAHGGDWHRQISLLAQESIDKMTAMGVEGLDPGKFAENITTTGIELHTLPVGTKLKLGECLTELTQIGKKCHHHCEIYKRIGTCIMPHEGIFVKVLEGGIVKANDEIKVV